MDKDGGGVFLRRTLTFRAKSLDTAAKTTNTTLLHRLGRVLQLGRVGDDAGAVYPGPYPTLPYPTLTYPT